MFFSQGNEGSESDDLRDVLLQDLEGGVTCLRVHLASTIDLYDVKVLRHQLEQ